MTQLPILDLIIIALSFIILIAISVYFNKDNKSGHDYFVGKKDIPWWAICGSIVATETSTLTFIGFPAMSYGANLNFIQLLFGYVIGRFIVSKYLLPLYLKGEIMTSYQFLGQSFGDKSRKVSSVLFMLTRLLGDGVRLYATAIPLVLLTGWSIEISIIIMMCITIIFSLIGGVKTIIWTDFLQLIIYLSGATVALILILNQTGGLANSLAAIPSEKFQIFDFSFNISNVNSFFYAFIGSILLTLSSHGTDQLIVQRILTSKNLAEAQKALIVSGFVVFVQIILFLFIGLFLYVFYNSANFIGEIPKGNDVFPFFIVHYLPSGFSGLVIASIFAAAISTLSSSLNSLASASIFDFKKQGNELFWGRVLTLFWGLLFCLVALEVKDLHKNIVTLGLSIASITYGGILGAFTLAFFKQKIAEKYLLSGLILGVLSTFSIWLYQLLTATTLVAWTLFIPIGLTVCLSVAIGLNKINK